MLKQVLIDDIDGAEGAETIRFSLNGNAYEIDLVQGNADKLAKALEPYIEVARKKGSRQKIVTVGKAKAVTKPTSSADMNAIRDWANGKGIKVSDRGRLPKDIVDQFNAAHNGKAAEFSHA